LKPINKFTLTMESCSNNEYFARAAVSAFITQLDPTLEELNDIKTAVSEAVTNCIVHAYPESVGIIYIWAGIYENGVFKVKIKDKGCGIQNVKQAMEPLFTTLGGERAGLGFAVMESFCDKIKVSSNIGKGTTVILEKHFITRGASDGRD